MNVVSFTYLMYQVGSLFAMLCYFLLKYMLVFWGGIPYLAIRRMYSRLLRVTKAMFCPR